MSTTDRPVSEHALGQIPQSIRRSVAAFQRDLPRLLQERPGQWVAYRGDEQVGFARSDLELYDLCLKRWDQDEFIVCCIEPPPGSIVSGPLAGAT